MGTLHEPNKILHPIFGQISQPHHDTSNTKTLLSTSSEEVREADVLLGERNHDMSGVLISREVGSLGDDQITMPKREESITEAEAIEVDPNADRRKRCKSTPPSSIPLGSDQLPKKYRRGSGSINAFDKLLSRSQPTLASAATAPHPIQAAADFNSAPTAHTAIQEEGLDVNLMNQTQGGYPTTTEAEETLDVNSMTTPVFKLSDKVATRPQKLLELNVSTGTIGPPPLKQASDHGTKKPTERKRGRKPKKQIVKIKYGSDKETRSKIGIRISNILIPAAGHVSIQEPQLPKVKPAPPAKPKGPPKITHPFFLGKKSLSSAPESKESDTKTSTGKSEASPRKLNRVGMVQPHPPTRKEGTTSLFTGFSGYGNASSKLTKFPGAVEPAWPWSGMVHIRDDGQSILPKTSLPKLTKSAKKLKSAAVGITAKEDVIGHLAKKMDTISIVEDLKNLDDDEFQKPPSTLRLPVRHFEPGHWLQCRLRKELVSKVPIEADPVSSSEDELQSADSRHNRVHPAIAKSYASLPTSLTAFDRYQYEPMLWTQKYAPQLSGTVLQDGKEVEILRDWLQALTVMSVETGADSVNSRRTSPGTKKDISKKRKRKNNKLDGFVISSEDDDDLDEFFDDEDELLSLDVSSGKKTLVKSGVLRGSKGIKRPNNAIVISGPHGSGKTASVYAVAKELGFEVFEINAGSRRNGKDIMEKVGDMARNHQVQRTKETGVSTPADEDMERLSEALDSDLRSGRQGTMNSFFKPKPTSNPAPKVTKSNATSKSAPSTNPPETSKKSSKSQKQSLILLEEVDILYEDDKLFWATITTLIAQSKRPVIMTCNDESVVPLQTLPLHAILRFPAPPVDLAVDYMLCVAANEGHLLRRKALKILYDSKHHDFRATLTELNFWCQMGLGDCRGGLEWFLPRYPKDTDVDEHGHTIRVISEGTYKTGLGWLNRDGISDDNIPLDIEEESLHQAWDNWGLDAGDWHETLRTEDWAQNLKAITTNKETRLGMLEIYDNFANSMSIADICTGHEISTGNEILLDPSVPDIPDKIRDDYIIGRPLLQANPLNRYQSTGTDIGLWMRSRARDHVQVDMLAKRWDVLPEFESVLESQLIERIKCRSTSPRKGISRFDFSLAFDPIAESENTSLSTSDKLEASIFDRTLSMLATDVAPFVRSIVTYDSKLQGERMRLSNLLSEGGKTGKRVRTTRAAMSALEGGHRKTTRKDKYFGSSLNAILVQRTGGEGWQEAASAAIILHDGHTSSNSSRETTPKKDGVDEILESSQ